SGGSFCGLRLLGRFGLAGSTCGTEVLCSDMAVSVLFLMRRTNHVGKRNATPKFNDLEGNSRLVGGDSCHGRCLCAGTGVLAGDVGRARYSMGYTDRPGKAAAHQR